MDDWVKWPVQIEDRSPTKRGRARFGRWSAGESVLPNLLLESDCAGDARGSKMQRDCGTGLQNR